MMTGNSNMSILASFVSLWITSFLGQNAQIVLGFILILSFGILHGANDIIVFKETNFLKKPISLLKLIFSYVFTILISAVLFIAIPWVALLLFVLVSGYHFGEQHWQTLNANAPKWLTPIFKFNYGIFILLLLFVFHTEEVNQIVFSIISIDVAFIEISYLLTFSGLTLAAFFTYFNYKSASFKKNMVAELLYLVVFSILFKVGSLIWGFALYFIFWHSIPSLRDQIQFLYGKYSFDNFKLYLRSAYLYWIISIAGIFILYTFLKEERIFNALFFSFLAAITFPHAWVILKMFNRSKEANP